LPINDRQGVLNLLIIFIDCPDQKSRREWRVQHPPGRFSR
jgi:hypothetical protein